MAPHLGFRTQAFDRAIEDIEAEIRIDDVVDDIAYRKQVDLRFLKLDDRTARIGEIMPRVTGPLIPGMTRDSR